MIKKRNILAVLAVMCLTLTSANASNLTQIDIKKTADSAVDVTFYTTGATTNPMVTRKSNNKYVILMPNVAGTNAGTPDLGAVRDIVTNVDVKNVDDGMNGYTKVTLITTKPVNIKTHMQKSAPISQEEQDAKALIAQVKSKPAATPEVTKTVVTSSKGTSAASGNTQPQKEESTAQTSKTSNKKVSNNSKDKSIPKILEQIPDKKISQAPVAPKSAKKAEPVLAVPTSAPDFSDTPAPTLDAKEVENIEKIKTEEKSASKAKAKADKSANKTPKGGWAIILFPILGLLFLAKLVRNSIQKSIALKASFEEHLAEKPYVQENYDDIINNSDMNWQERYKKFVEESKGEIKDRKYSFISNVKLSDIDKKRLELEGTLNKTPDIYEEHNMDLTSEEPSQVKSEDEAITGELSGLKLRAFARPVSLHSTIRNKTVPAQLRPRMKEGRHVNLEQTPLNTPHRRFKDANLSVSDLINTSKRYIEDENSSNDNSKNYTMSSIDEYFAILDEEKSKVVSTPKDLSSKVAASLANVKPSMQYKKTSATKSSTNPIMAKNRTADYFNGLIVKTGYNIDENRGFYLVNLDGVNALVGRVGEEIFVLKKFDTEVNDLQVRLDSGNVYMVKAGEFKSLVDVDENKMGVLIEL